MRLSSDARLRHPSAVNSVHHSGSIVFRPLGVLTFRGRVLVCVVVALTLAMRVEHDREIGHDCPRLWKQFICLSGLGTVQPVHAAV